MKIKIFVITGLLPILAFAGNAVGNGGHGISCPSESPSIQSLDLYEARALHGFNLDFSGAKSESEVISLGLQRISRIDPVRAKLMMDKINDFGKNAAFVQNSELTFTDDAASIVVPKGCSLVQLIVRRKKTFPMEKKYIVDMNAWAQMDFANRAAMIFHEIFYEQMEIQNSTTSNARLYNGLLWSDQFSKLDQYQNSFITASLKFDESYIGNCTTKVRRNQFDQFGNITLEFEAASSPVDCAFLVGGYSIRPRGFSYISLSQTGKIVETFSSGGFDWISVAGGQVLPLRIQFADNNRIYRLETNKPTKGLFIDAGGNSAQCTPKFDSVTGLLDHLILTFNEDGNLESCK